MRGTPPRQTSMLCLQSPEAVVPAEPPLRKIKTLVDAALAKVRLLLRLGGTPGSTKITDGSVAGVV